VERREVGWRWLQRACRGLQRCDREQRLVHGDGRLQKLGAESGKLFRGHLGLVRVSSEQCRAALSEEHVDCLRIANRHRLRLDKEYEHKAKCVPSRVKAQGSCGPIEFGQVAKEGVLASLLKNIEQLPQACR